VAIYELKLLLYGLIALHPDHPTTPETMHAYLIDARQPSAASDGCPQHCHVPFIAFEIAPGGECQKELLCKAEKVESCDPTRQRPTYCFCDVTRRAISFYPAPKQAAGTALAYYPPSAVPSDSGQAKDFVWTLRMRSVEPTAAKITDGLLRQKAVADLEFGWTALQTCHLATVDDEGPIGVYRFKPLASTTPAPMHRQVGSEAAMATLKVESEPHRKPILRLTSYDDERDVKEISFPCTATGHAEETCNPIHLVNRAFREDDGHDGRCGEGVKGREFEQYYKLSEISPLQFRQVVPHLARVADVPDRDLQPERCSPCFLKPTAEPNDDCKLGVIRHAFEETKAVSGRPICMMVVFD